MSSEFDDLVSHITNDERHQSLAPLLLAVLTGYNCGELEVDDYSLDLLKQACCDNDPDWARAELWKETTDCDRCHDLTVLNLTEEFKMRIGKKSFEKHVYCEECHAIVRQMEQEYDSDDNEDSDDEEDVDDKVQREADWAAELSMGK